MFSAITSLFAIKKIGPSEGNTEGVNVCVKYNLVCLMLSVNL